METLSLLRGQVLHYGSDLVVLDKDGSGTPENSEARPLGAGASGAVYRVAQVGGLERAVKILAPSPKLLARVGIEKLIGVFDKERVKLSRLTHSHIAKLISFGVIERAADGGAVAKLPYLVMEFVEGVRLHEFLSGLSPADVENNLKTVVTLLSDILGALSYMHDRSAMHGDVKEANIIVRQADREEAVLVDLGCAHIFAPTISSEDLTYFNSTRSRNSPKWVARLGQLVPAQELNAERVKVDLYQFGTMLQLLTRTLDYSGDNEFAWQRATSQVLAPCLGKLGGVVLQKIAERCVEGKYQSAAEARDDLQVLLPGYVSPLGVPQLSLGSDAVTSIALPEGRIALTNNDRHLINHPCVQRLHGIAQLDFVRLLCPGATHTRFLHSLQAFELTRHYVGALLGDPHFRAYASDRRSIEAVLLLGLLHDVGHYPLEHVFEDFAAKNEKSGPYADALTDEQVAAAILNITKDAKFDYIRTAAQRACQAASGTLRREIPNLPRLITERFGAQTLQRIGEIVHPPTGDVGAQILHSIIDSAIDVDKVAYLGTDSLMTGAEYGQGVDLDGLLSSMTCFVGGKIGDVAIAPSVAVSSKGICAVESVVTSRRWMFQRVYWHHTNRAMMAMLRFPIQVLLDHGAMTFQEYFSATYTFTDVEAVKWVDGRFRELTAEKGLLIENPALALIEGRRGPYKRLLEIGVKESGARQKARNHLLNRPCMEWLKVASDIAGEIRKCLNKPDLLDSDVLLDLPVSDRPDLSDFPVVSSSRGIQLMSGVSDQFRNSQEFFRAGSMFCRVFIHPALRIEINRNEEVKTSVEQAVLSKLAG